MKIMCCMAQSLSVYLRIMDFGSMHRCPHIYNTYIPVTHVLLAACCCLRHSPEAYSPVELKSIMQIIERSYMEANQKAKDMFMSLAEEMVPPLWHVFLSST